MKIKIAVVDDHILFRSGVVSLLKEHDHLHVCIQASNGRELLDQLENDVPDLVLLDIQMPVMNGIETTSALKEIYPDIKIIILTMHNESEFIYDLMSKGANGFIPKNKSIDILLEAIESVMERGYYYNDQITEALIKGREDMAFTSESEPGLTDREIEIIRLICAQKSNKEIAEILDISPRTVDSHKTNIFTKTGAKNIIGVALFAVQTKLIG